MEDNSTTVDFDDHTIDHDVIDRTALEYEMRDLGDNVSAKEIDRNIWEFTALEHWNGEVTGVTIMATDTFGLTANTTIKVVVKPVADPPEIVTETTTPDPAHKVIVDEGQVQNFTVGIWDPDGGPGKFITTKIEWFLDGMALPTVVNGTYSFKPDYDSAGVHTIIVEITDDEVASYGFNVTWTVEVMDINRLPIKVKIETPEHNTTFKQGKKIEFKAQTASDPDGDSLTYTWYSDDQPLPGGGNQTFTYKKLKPGEHKIKLEVSDGRGGVVTDEVTIKVKKQKQEPGFEAALLFLALVAVALVLIRKRR
jgi:hypothetical protein